MKATGITVLSFKLRDGFALRFSNTLTKRLKSFLLKQKKSVDV